MNQNIKNFIEEGEKEFDKLFDKQFHATYQDAKQFIYSRQISLIKMIVEACEVVGQDEVKFGQEKSKRYWVGHGDALLRVANFLEGKMTGDTPRALSKALDTISSKLKELTDGK